tara:strand:- start:36267 stop:38207 length:1941 start_codon:yes stop_codon:yes gene_type:complete
MNQCSNCGAPIIRSAKTIKYECEYCGQSLSSGGNIYVLRSVSNFFGASIKVISKNIKYISSNITKNFEGPKARGGNALSYNIQNINSRLGNYIKKRNVRYVLSIALISGITVLASTIYIRNSGRIYKTIANSGNAFKSLRFNFNSCNANYSNSKLISMSRPGVARIFTKKSSGSGFVVRHANNQTFILTNSHVVAGSSKVYIVWSDGEEDIADVVMDSGFSKNNPSRDLALLRVPGIEGKLLKIQKKSVLIGSDVIAVGQPEGFEYSFTKGIVSAIRDNEKIIQHDAAINSGNSGGPLIGKSGCVVGVNTYVVMSSDGQNAEGLGFAISGKTALRFINKYSSSSKSSLDSRISTTVPGNNSDRPINSANKNKEASKYISMARKIYTNENKSREAIQLLIKSLSIKETSQAHLYLALLMSRLDNNGESLNYFTKAINLNSFWGNDLKISDAYYRRGLLNYKLKNNDKAIKDFNFAIRRDSTKPEYFNSRCIVKKNRNSFNSALIDCLQTIELNPNHQEAYNNLGLVKIGLNDFQGAINAYSKQLLISPDNKFSHYLRGNAYAFKGDMKNACADWLKSSSIYGDKASAKKLERSCYDFSSQNQNNYQIENQNNSNKLFNPLEEELRNCKGDVSLFCKNLRRGKFKLKK